MGSEHRITAALVTGLALVAGCKRAPAPSPQPSAAASSAPPDRLAAGEAPPGVQRAHDLVLPREARIDARFGTAIYVTVARPLDEVANFVRQQSDDPQGVVGANGTIFPNLKVRGSDPGHHLRVEVSTLGLGAATEIIVDRIEERPPVDKVPQAQAMEGAGLTPDGKLIHPEKIE